MPLSSNARVAAANTLLDRAYGKAPKELRLFPGRKVAALGKRVEVDDLGIGPLGPTPRRGIDLVMSGVPSVQAHRRPTARVSWVTYRRFQLS